MSEKKKKVIPLWVVISLLILAVSCAVYYASVNDVLLADRVNSGFSVLVRRTLAYITSIIPFSLFELVILLAVPILITIVVISLKFDKTFRAKLRRLFSIIGLIALIISTYIFTLGIGYRTTPLAERLGIENRADILPEELYMTAIAVRDELNALADTVEFDGSETVMPYTFEELSSKIVSAYDSYSVLYTDIYNFESRAKPVIFSSVMSDLRISGIYSFPTGEANINMSYPDYNLPFTVAHEFAHQRGICRENEANFTAFLVCISSDDAYVRYSGYLNLYEYIASALYRADKELYADVYSTVSSVAIADIKASNAVYKAHEDSFLGELNEKLNDSYLKLNGTEGTVSYSYVVRLAVGYYKDKIQ